MPVGHERGTLCAARDIPKLFEGVGLVLSED